MTNLILREKIAKMSEVKSNPAKTLRGFVRVVAEDKKATTRGFFFDKDAFEDLLESMEYSTSDLGGNKQFKELRGSLLKNR